MSVLLGGGRRGGVSGRFVAPGGYVLQSMPLAWLISGAYTCFGGNEGGSPTVAARVKPRPLAAFPQFQILRN